jgi:hypothetical protein
MNEYNNYYKRNLEVLLFKNELKTVYRTKEQKEKDKIIKLRGFGFASKTI